MQSILYAFSLLDQAIQKDAAALPESVSLHLEALRGSLQRCTPENQATVFVPSHLRWIRLSDGSVMDLSRRPALQRITTALFRARVERPGQPLSARELIAAGWPEEQPVVEDAITHSAKMNRLYVSLTRLRKLGLMDLLDCVQTGWMIRLDVRVQTDSVERVTDRVETTSESVAA